MAVWRSLGIGVAKHKKRTCNVPKPIRGTLSKRGRPVKECPDGERVSLGLKVTAHVKRRLRASALISGRSLSQEAEHRIELSYVYEAFLGNIDVKFLGFKFKDIAVSP